MSGAERPAGVGPAAKGASSDTPLLGPLLGDGLDL